ALPISGLVVGCNERVADARERDRVAAFVGHDAPTGTVQQFTQAAYERTDQHEEREASPIVHGDLDPEAVARFDEKVVQSYEAEKSGQQPWPQAAEISRDHDCWNERDVQ